MKNFIKILIVIAMGLFLNSCYYDSFPQDIDDGGGGEIPEDISYKNDIQPMWDADCVACHPTVAPPDLRPGTSYNSLLNGGYVIAGNADDSVLYQSLLGSNGVSLMPPGAMWPTSKIKTVEVWINEGAKDN